MANFNMAGVCLSRRAVGSLVAIALVVPLVPVVAVVAVEVVVPVVGDASASM